MDTRPDHAASMRVMAGAVARDLERIVAGDQVCSPIGLSSLFRTHAGWTSHGWYGDPSMEPMRSICSRVFPPQVDPRAFVRGMRSVAGIVIEGSDEPPGTLADRDVFWACVDGLAAETGVRMPARSREGRAPMPMGH